MSAGSRLAHVREVFGQALGVPAEERAAWLARACAGDEDLRREVADLLALDEPAGAAPSGEPAASLAGLPRGAEWLASELGADAASNTPDVPKDVGGFRIVREIGRGGMGVVYEAMQREPERRVALKVIHFGLLTPATLRRFRQEVRVLARLRHPGVVQIFEAGEFVVGGVARPYLVMEYIEGDSLRRYIDEGRGSMESRLALIMELCEAVSYAHQRGIVHRDLKPENILLASDHAGALAGAGGATNGSAPAPGPPRPRILDFGVCRWLEAPDSAASRTLAGQIVGTPPYISPEQAQGEAHLTDTRSDVYALGVVAFELLSGQLPLNVRGTSTAHALHAVLHGVPRRLGSVAPRLRGDLESIVHKAMAHEPARRYQSAHELAADIARHLRREPVLARPPRWSYVVGRFVRRHRALTALGATLACVIVVALVVVLIFWGRANEAREAARRQNYASSLSAASFAIARGDIATARQQLLNAPPEYRGWEFGHIESRLDDSREVLTPPVRPPFALARTLEPGAFAVVSPTELRTLHLGSAGAVAAGAGASEGTPDPRLRLWHAAHASRFPELIPIPEAGFCTPLEGGGVRHHALTAVRKEFDAIARARLSASERVLAFTAVNTTSGQERVGVLDLESDALVWVPSMGSGRVLGLALRGDGEVVAFGVVSEGAERPSMVMVNTRSGAVIAQTPELPRMVSSLVFAPDGSRVYATLFDGSLEAWALHDGQMQQVRRRAHTHDSASNLCVSPDGKWLASGARDQPVRVFDAGTLVVAFEFVGHQAEIYDVLFASDSGELLSADTSGQVRRWSLDHAPVARPLVIAAHTHLVHPIAFAAGRREVVLGSWDRTITLHDLETGQERARASVDRFVLDLALSPDESLLVSREYEGQTRLWDARTLAPIASFDHPLAMMDQPLWRRDSTQVATGVDLGAGTARVIDVGTRTTATIPLSDLRAFVGPTIDAGAGVLALTRQVGSDIRVIFCGFDDRRERFGFAARRTGVEAFSFTPDRQGFVFQDAQNRLQLYDLRTFTLVRTFSGHTREVLATAFTPDGSRMFSADLTGVIRVWDVASGAEVGQLIGHTQHVRRLVMTPDGHALISGSRDGTARVWSSSAAPPP